MNPGPFISTRSSLPARLASRLVRADVLLLAAIVLLAVAVRIAWVVYIDVDSNDGRFDDSVFYHNTGRLLAHGLGYVNPYGGGPTAQRMPGYPLALALVYKLGGWHMVLAQALNIVFAAITVVLVYLVGLRIFDRRAAYIGALVLALFPGQIYFSALLYAETMFAMLFTLVLLLTIAWSSQRSGVRWWQALLLGVLIGASALVRDEGVVLLFVLVTFWALTMRPWRSTARNAALAAFTVALALAPWTMRNAVQLHAFVPLRENAGGTVARHLEPPTVGVGLPGEDQDLVETLRNELRHPAKFLSSTVDNLLAFYENDSDGIKSASIRVSIPPFARDNIRSVYGNGDGQSGFGLEPPPAWFSDDFTPLLTRAEEAPWRRLANSFFFAAGAAALVAAAISLIRRNQASLVLILAAITWTLLFSILFPSVTRYHYPLGPVISVLTGAFIVSGWDGGVLAWRTLAARTSGERTSAP